MCLFVSEVNFQTLIITIAVVGGVFIIALLICLFCCCKCENFGTKRFENKMQKQSDKTRTKQQERSKWSKPILQICLRGSMKGCFHHPLRKFLEVIRVPVI
uniref:Uncharacterized protein n=1 Tax=Gouania willdenowi TaxID=441366 RepID=A0A8C5HZI1_GOUWI